VTPKKHVTLPDSGRKNRWTSPPVFLLLTNDETVAAEAIVRGANGRCHQENLIEQLKFKGVTEGMVGAEHPPYTTTLKAQLNASYAHSSISLQRTACGPDRVTPARGSQAPRTA
jgi:hypothetical protein